jgi:multidrug efflux pump subunit AcrA (membrane-fusion protein)
VQVVPIARGTLDVTLQAYGQTDVLDRQNIVSPIDGTVTSLSVEVGSSVQKGDTLALIRTRDSEASIAGAQRLIDEATTPEQLATAKKAMQVAIESQQLVPIATRGAGVVVEKMVSDKQAVTANTVLVQLVDLATLDFVANVPLQEIPRVKVGEPCRIHFLSLPGREFDGSVAAVSAQSEPGSQAAPVRISFQTPVNEIESTLRIGMMGTVDIVTGVLKDVLVVPRSALLRDDITGAYTIYTVNPDSLAIAVPVTVGVVNDSLAQVSAPSLAAGEPVIVEGNYEVSDSTRVTVKGGQQQ